MIKSAIIVALALLTGTFAMSAESTNSFKIANGQFLLNGKPFTFRSGEMHPSRIPHQYWRQRIQMAKACGLNSLGVYIMWNMHEPEKGKFSFTGQNDIAKFCKIAQEEGLYVILRPGPYVCAEWDFGGFPYWLLTEPGMTIRANNKPFLDRVGIYFKQLAKQLLPHEIQNGGNILMTQVENEYGSYGNDHEYMANVKKALETAGFAGPFFTCDGGSLFDRGTIPGVLAGANGSAGDDLFEVSKKHFGGGPYIVPEAYPGWLDHWGEPHSKVSTESVVKDLNWYLSHNVSFNFYMFHGGTNFGWMAGANYGANFQPQPTSYDYDAPLDEAGRPTPKFMAIRAAIEKHLGKKLPLMPPTPKTMTIPEIEFTEFDGSTIFSGMTVAGGEPQSMEALGQAYGWIVYRTEISGKAQQLSITTLRDYALVCLSGRIVGTLDRRRNQKTIDLPESAAWRRSLEIIVENGGRINYGGRLLDNKKGILGDVSIGENFDPSFTQTLFSAPPNPGKYGKVLADRPGWLRATFTLTETNDTFLDMRGWGKGNVWVNGHHLGRFWDIGPQQTLYLPGVWLKKGKNKIEVFTYGKKFPAKTRGLAEPILDELHKEPALIPANRTKTTFTGTLPAAAKVAEAQLAKDGKTEMTWGAQKGRYFAFRTESAHDKGPYASCAELNLLGPDNKPLPRTGWKIAYVSSEELGQEDGKAENMLDNDPATIWHSEWATTSPKHPHTVVIDLGKVQTITGVNFLQRPTDSPGKTKSINFFVLQKID